MSADDREIVARIVARGIPEDVAVIAIEAVRQVEDEQYDADMDKQFRLEFERGHT